MQLLDPTRSTRRWLNVGLVLGGALAGATFGLVLTRVGKIVAGAPPATLRNYVWNAAVFGVLAGVVSPVVSWSALRRVPLWRTVVEPLAYAVAGAAIAVIVGVPALILALPPIGLVAGFVRLHRRHAVPRLTQGPQYDDSDVIRRKSPERVTREGGETR